MARYQRLTLMAHKELIHRAPSTLSRELTCHWTSPVYLSRGARPSPGAALGSSATQTAHARRPACLRAAVLHLLAHRWSPEQIAHGLPMRYPDDPTMRISHKAIYTVLSVLPSGGSKWELARYLRRRHRFHRPHKGIVSSRNKRRCACTLLIRILPPVALGP